MVKNACSQSCDGTLKLTVSEEWTDGINLFFACWYMMIKADQKFFGWAFVKNRCGQSDQGTPKFEELEQME